MQSALKNSSIVFAGIIFVAILAAFASRVQAQPSTLVVQTTAAATTTTTYMTAGTATTTYQIDSYPVYNSSKVFSMAGIDSATMFVVFNSAQATSTLAYQIQVSNTGSDWYGLTTPTSATPGSTGYFGIASSTANTYYYASGIGGNASSTNEIAINLPAINALHERVVFSIPVGSPPGAIYEEFVLKRNASGQ